VKPKTTMDVKLVRIEDGVQIHSKIEACKGHRLPTFHDGWRFNFNKHSKTSGAQTFVLLTEESPETIEGCVILKKQQHGDHYMAFVEIAPHNQGKGKKYDKVAGCLIAYACRVSHIQGDGFLSFHIGEESQQKEKKLMIHYSKKYLALRIADTKEMIIVPGDGQKLISQYLG
jgi:hypothetical protein